MRESLSESAGEAAELDPAWLRAFRRRVLAWYARHGRELPFRTSRDPYRVWISEVMLQQTTVTAVLPYFERFLARFPTVELLAAATEHDVLRLWEGLGYYSRARNLHAAAKRIAVDPGRGFPHTAAELANLPGIGRYTAAAIASFAFDEPAAIVEANTLRLYARLTAYRDDPKSTAGQKRLWEFAGRIVPKQQPGRFNHALMDLGATVCTVRNPQCERCPVRRNCRAFEANLQHTIPALKPRPAATDVTEAYVVVRKDASYLLRRRTETERWAGLWDFPRYELPGSAADTVVIPPPRNGQAPLPFNFELPAEVRSRLEQQVSETAGIEVDVEGPFDEIRHGVTRFRIRVLCFSARFRAGRLRRGDGLRWVEREALAELALSRPGRRLAERLDEIAT